MTNEDKPENKTSMDKFGWSKVQKNEINVQDDMNLEDTRASERGNELEQEERLEPEDELVSEDALIPSVGPVTRARAKRFSQAIGRMLKEIVIQTNPDGKYEGKACQTTLVLIQPY